MKVFNINSNNPKYIIDLVVRYLIINQVEYLAINYDDYYEVHFNDTIFRIRYSLVDCNENILLQSISDIEREKVRELENSMVNIKPIKQKKKKFPKPKNNQFQLSKKKNKFIYERNSRLNNRSYRRY